jgi:hypothetical protein
MSRGQLNLRGGYYPRTITLGKTIQEYFNPLYQPAVGACSDCDDFMTLDNWDRYRNAATSARAEAIRDVLDSVAADTSFPLSTFSSDFNGSSGTLDYVWVVFRGMVYDINCASIGVFSDCAAGTINRITLNFNVCSGAAGAQSALGHAVTWNGKSLTTCAFSWQTSGSSRDLWPSCPGACPSCLGQVHTFAWYRRLMAHEFTHGLLRNTQITTSHLNTISGYSVIADDGNILDAFSRWQLGWLVAADTISVGEEGTFILHESVAHDAPGFGSGDPALYVINPDPVNQQQKFLLEDRRRSTVYAEEIPLNVTGDLVKSGSRSSGLLVYHFHQGAAANFDCCQINVNKDVQKLLIESAAGMWDTTYRPDPVSGETVTTSNLVVNPRKRNSSPEDAFDGGRSNTWAPYTCPNTNLYAFTTTPDDQSLVSGLTIQ